MHITLHLAVSKDGFIAKQDGDSNWVSPADEELFRQRVKDAGAVVVGKRTFDQYAGSIYPVEGAVNITLTHQSREGGRYSNVVSASSPEEAVAVAKERGIDNMVIAGGAMTAQSFLDAGLIDEIFFSVHPIVLEKGIGPFGPELHDTRYTLIGKKDLGEGIEELHYTMV